MYRKKKEKGKTESASIVIWTSRSLADAFWTNRKLADVLRLSAC